MYVVLVGPPAARKGTAMDQAKPFLDDLDIRVSAESTTREALIRALRETTDNIVSAEGTLRALHSSMTIWAQELTVFLGYNNLQLMSDLTDWYDCRPRWTYRTKHEGVDEIIGVYVNLFGATTPDLIRSSMPLDAIGGGLTSRMIFVFEPNKGKVVPYTSLDQKLKDSLLKDLRRIHMLSGRFRVEKGFRDDWINWYIEQEGKPPFNDSRFAGYFERRATHILKLSCIISAARSDEMIISRKDLERAISFLEKTEIKMSQTFSGVGKSSHADVLAKVMSDIGMAGEVNMSSMIEKYRSDADKWTMEKIVETLAAMKYIKIINTPTEIILRHRKKDGENV